MFYALVIAVGLALSFAKLGALSVWVTVLSGLVCAMAVLFMGLVLLLGWRAWMRRRDPLSSCASRVYPRQRN